MATNENEHGADAARIKAAAEAAVTAIRLSDDPAIVDYLRNRYEARRSD